MADGFHLAQANISFVQAPLSHPSMADFLAADDPLDSLARLSAGFVWRRTLPSPAAAIVDFEGRAVLLNVSTWTDIGSLVDYVHRSRHGEVARRGAEWFEQEPRPTAVLWWVPQWTRPTPREALARIAELREAGPTARAFTMARRFTPEGNPEREGNPS